MKPCGCLQIGSSGLDEEAGPDQGSSQGIARIARKQNCQIISSIFDLLVEPNPHYSKPLEGASSRRIAVGEFRVVYRADDESVYVLACGKRNDDEVYRSLQRKQ